MSHNISHRMKNSHPVSIVACLDLHGMIKEQAISNFTTFIERYYSSGTASSTWVKVVTGTGQHSSHTGGPVLRGAIQRLLEKREMEYFYEKGCFIVNAKSGKVLHKATVENTKLRIEAYNYKENIIKLTGRAVNNNTTRGVPQQVLVGIAEPLPHQVAADDEMVQKVKQKSVTEFNQEKRLEQKDRHALEKAVMESQLILKQEQEEEKELLERALSLSQQVVQQEEQQEEQLQLERALSLSQLHFNQEQDDETKQLEKALLLSQQQQQASPILHLDEEEEQRLLQQAIALSLQEQTRGYL